MGNNLIELLEYSYKNNCGHIPSALSHYPYLLKILPTLTNERLKENINICIGKPFGSQAYYVIWKKMGLIDFIPEPILNHKEFDFIDFSDTTLGNALGVASGMTMVNSKKSWVNISDSVFQIGTTMESLQYIGLTKLNILITVDFNENKLVSKLPFDLNYVLNLLESFKIKTTVVKDINNFKFDIDDYPGPHAIIFLTEKGYGIKECIDNPKEWHYRKIKSEEELGRLLKDYRKGEK